MKKFLAIIMTIAMMCSMSSAVFAADVTDEASAEVLSVNSKEATTYVSSSGSFSVSTGVMNCNQDMGWGTYKVNYNVSRPCTLSMWVDSYTTYDVATLSGSGETEISVPLFRTYRGWQLWAVDVGDTSTITYSITITK